MRNLFSLLLVGHFTITLADERTGRAFVDVASGFVVAFSHQAGTFTATQCIGITEFEKGNCVAGDGPTFSLSANEYYAVHDNPTGDNINAQRQRLQEAERYGTAEEVQMFKDQIARLEMFASKIALLDDPLFIEGIDSPDFEFYLKAFALGKDFAAGQCSVKKIIPIAYNIVQRAAQQPRCNGVGLLNACRTRYECDIEILCKDGYNPFVLEFGEVNWGLMQICRLIGHHDAS